MHDCGVSSASSVKKNRKLISCWPFNYKKRVSGLNIYKIHKREPKLYFTLHFNYCFETAAMHILSRRLTAQWQLVNFQLCANRNIQKWGPLLTFFSLLVTAALKSSKNADSFILYVTKNNDYNLVVTLVVARWGMDWSGGGSWGRSVCICTTTAVSDPAVGVIAHRSLMAWVIVLVDCGLSGSKKERIIR